jgi:hypothetical protein
MKKKIGMTLVEALSYIAMLSAFILPPSSFVKRCDCG